MHNLCCNSGTLLCIDNLVWRMAVLDADPDDEGVGLQTGPCGSLLRLERGLAI